MRRSTAGWARSGPSAGKRRSGRGRGGMSLSFKSVATMVTTCSGSTSPTTHTVMLAGW